LYPCLTIDKARRGFACRSWSGVFQGGAPRSGVPAWRLVSRLECQPERGNGSLWRKARLKWQAAVCLGGWSVRRTIHQARPSDKLPG